MQGSIRLSFFVATHIMVVDVLKSKGGKRMNCVASMRSMTYAMKAKRAFWEKGINCEITSLSPDLTRHGCAYGVKFDCRYESAVRALLNSIGLRFSELIALPR